MMIKIYWKRWTLKENMLTIFGVAVVIRVRTLLVYRRPGKSRNNETSWTGALSNHRGSWDPVSELKCTAKVWYIKVTSIVDTIFAIFFKFIGVSKKLENVSEENWDLLIWIIHWSRRNLLFHHFPWSTLIFQVCQARILKFWFSLTFHVFRDPH